MLFRATIGKAAMCAAVLSLSGIAAWAGVEAEAPSPATATTQPAATVKPALPAAKTTAPPARKTGDKVAEPDAPTSVELTRPGTFRINVRGADLRVVLELLSNQGRRNIIATKDVTGKVTADLYDVTFKEALDAVLESSGFVYREKGNFIFVYTSAQLEKILAAERKIDIRTFRLAYVTANDAKLLITPVLSKEGMIAVTPVCAQGITMSVSETGGNAYATSDVLVVRDYEDNLKRIEEIIREVDIRPEQVLIEATVLRAKLTEENALGIDFNTLAGIDFESMNSTSSGLTNIKTGDISGSQLNNPKATFRTDLSGAVPTGGMSIGFISNNVSFFVRALESVTDLTIMANPKLLVVNKQRGEVMVGNKDGYLTTTFTETTATQTVQFLETGTKLVVRPFIGKDGYVRLEIHPEDSFGNVRQVGQAALPTETTTEVTSNVLVRDGHTIVIGGLFRDETTAGRSQVPLAGNIPYLGALFRTTVDDTKREEVIILVTPRVIKHANDEAVSEGIAADCERFRVGARKGVMWWGHDRLAEAYCSAARKALADGDRGKALWNVDLALSMNPKMIEAIQLKERLTEKAYWSRSVQESDIHWVIQRMVMQELGKPVQRVIPPTRPLDEDKIDPEVRKALGIEKAPQDPLMPGPPARLKPRVTPPAKPAAELPKPTSQAPSKATGPKEPAAAGPAPAPENKTVIIRREQSTSAPAIAQPQVKSDAKVSDQKPKS